MKKRYPSTVLQVIGLIVISMIISSPLVFIESKIHPNLYSLLVLVSMVSVVFIFSYIKNRKRIVYKISSSLNKEEIKKISVIGLLIVILFQLFINPYIFTVVGHLTNRLFNTSSNVSNSISVMVLFSIILVGPISEEFIFRKIIFKGFLTNYSPKKAIIYSSILFSLIHFMPSQLIGAFLLGLLFAYIFYYTGKFIIPVIFHVIANFIGIMPAIIKQSTDIVILPTNSTVQFTLFIITSLIISIFINKMFQITKNKI